MGDHPGRFQGLACLPTPDPAAAADEARRAIGELGLCGTIVQGHTGGRFLDAPEFDPVLAAVEGLGVPDGRRRRVHPPSGPGAPQPYPALSEREDS